MIRRWLKNLIIEAFREEWEVRQAEHNKLMANAMADAFATSSITQGVNGRASFGMDTVRY